jgi:diketogulonate reductase-like aldo/keto reductase
MLALGTGSRGCSPPAACQAAIEQALNLGWRTIDCAWEYGTQPLVAAALSNSGVPRTDVYLISKIPGPVGAAQAASDFKDDLARLGTGYVDLLLMHYPCGPAFAQPRDGCGAVNDTADAAARIDTWRAMEGFVADGRARAIGVSNWRQEHIAQLLAAGVRAPVAVNQVQWHLGFHDDALLEYCLARGIRLQAYSPLGGGGTSQGRDGGVALDDPLVTRIAVAHSPPNTTSHANASNANGSSASNMSNTSNAQVALRWAIQRGVAVATSATTRAYLLEDLRVVGSGGSGGAPVLSGVEVAALSALGAGAVPRTIVVDDWPDVSMPVVALHCGAGAGTGSSSGSGSGSGRGSACSAAGVQAWASAGGRHVAVSAGAAAATATRAGLAAAVRAGVAARDELFVTVQLASPLGYEGTLRWANETWLAPPPLPPPPAAAAAAAAAGQQAAERVKGGAAVAASAGAGADVAAADEGVGWIDLLLLNAPCADGTGACPATGPASAAARAAVRETWRAMAALRAAGKVRALGVGAGFSNTAQLEWIVGGGGGGGGVGAMVGDDPAANASALSVAQLEWHVGHSPPAVLTTFLRSFNVSLQATADRPFAHPVPAAAAPLLAAAAAAHNRSAEQVGLRWALQAGAAVVASVAMAAPAPAPVPSPVPAVSAPGAPTVAGEADVSGGSGVSGASGASGVSGLSGVSGVSGGGGGGGGGPAAYLGALFDFSLSAQEMAAISAV